MDKTIIMLSEISHKEKLYIDTHNGMLLSYENIKLVGWRVSVGWTLALHVSLAPHKAAEPHQE